MSKITQKGIYGMVAMLGMAFLTVITAPVSAAVDFSLRNGVDLAHGDGQPTNLFGVDGIFNTVANILLFIVGALSVLMLIIGGIRYVVSGGNQTAVTAAKNTILYAIVGLVIALLAYAVINFVLTTLVPGSGGSGTNV
ncbi:MAG TPA: hypothetical protein PKC86_00510 [Candidatus Saccharibacteria bacterium]|nr:hypothetical protein [Candidatus Saccharibacteria bacterium]